MPPNNYLSKLLILLLVASFPLCKIKAQSKTALDSLRPHILVKARAQKGKILLRWAVDKPTEWQRANKSGFIVERYVTYTDRDSQLRFVRRKLTTEPLKPLPLEKWRDVAQKDDNAAIIAQSLYGAKFGIQNKQEKKETNMSDMMSVTDELTLRHSFALLSADMNFEASCMAGWGYVDSFVVPNIDYYYRIYVADDKSNVKIDTGVVIVKATPTPIPSPLMFKGQFGNKTAMLSWDNQWQVGQYTSYVLERSEDTTHFMSVTKKPIINLSNDEKPMPSFMYNDTLPSNNKVYYYRLRGITCFGELSEPTAIIQGIGKEQLSFSPNIVETNILNDTTVVIKWDIVKDSTIKLLTSFEVSLADQDNGDYKIVLKNLNKNSRTATYVGSLSSNYFIVTAVDINGQKYSSFPQLVQTIDSIAPNPPIGLTGIIDSNNIVKLTWQPNTEKDLHGYHIFRSNVKDEEMSILTVDPIVGNTFTDTLSSKLGNEKVYYAIVALDQRFNQSVLSDTAIITRPDKNPPVSPVFKDFKLEEDKVHLYWENSTSDDIAFQRLYKKVIANNNSSDNTWELLKEFTSLDSVSYTDTEVKQGTIVGYTLIAIDKNKNEATPSVPLTVQIPIDRRNKVAVKELRAVADRKSKKILVEWVYGEKGVAEYQIYKTAGKQPLSLWKVAENTTVAIIDEDISPSNLYKYAVRAVFKDGTMSHWKEVNVEF
jgi:uncharacterized protein